MGVASAATALRNVMDVDSVREILSFLDTCSVVTTYATDASDIANLEDVCCTSQGWNHRVRQPYRRTIFFEQNLYHGSLEYPKRL